MTIKPFVALGFLASLAHAQSVSVYGGSANFESATQSGHADAGAIYQATKMPPCDQGHRGEFAAAPIPIVNPTIGDGLGGALLYLTSFDPCEDHTQPSTFAIAGFATNNGSYGFGGGTNLLLRRDTFRITAGLGGGIFHYPFFGIGNAAGASGLSVDIAQRSAAFLIEPKMRVFGRWYVGPRYHIIKSTVTLNGSNTSNVPVPLPDLKLRTAALGLRLQNDTRDDSFYPHRGAFFDSTLDFFDAAFGGARSYRGLLVSYNKYVGFGVKNVLAMRGSMCASWNGAPFYDLCLLGQSQDLRGYDMGRYRDQRMLAAQIEYRRELFWRIGIVAFMGAGEVGKTFGDFNSSDILPGGGAGLRFLLTRKSHVNLRADYALGRDSHAVYVGIGEAF